ncbi:MAG: tRNA dihydrouridine(20/20a) synthase DusA [Pseudomonadota bacterium]
MDETATPKPAQGAMPGEHAASGLDRRLSVAPMMDWTDRHQRMLMRKLAPNTLLFTEMVTTGAILHGDAERHLAFDRAEHPLALQLGGSDADDLARATDIAQRYGYDEINLNCGCPSDRVKSGRFGACLMAEPDHVAQLVTAMTNSTDRPVTIKCRIGIDQCDSGPFLDDFVDAIAETGCHTFYIHARQAWLQGLSPKENRDVPPLDYDRVRRLKQRRPELEIILNGGLKTIKAMQSALEPDKALPALDGVMIGREAYQNPLIMARAERLFFPQAAQADHTLMVADRLASLEDYVIARLAAGTPLKSITRHMMGLMNGRPGARAWRRQLSAVPQDDSITWQDIVAQAAAIEKGGHRNIAA